MSDQPIADFSGAQQEALPQEHQVPLDSKIADAAIRVARDATHVLPPVEAYHVRVIQLLHETEAYQANPNGNKVKQFNTAYDASMDVLEGIDPTLRAAYVSGNGEIYTSSPQTVRALENQVQRMSPGYQGFEEWKATVDAMADDPMFNGQDEQPQYVN